ncbi:MAG: signal peptidase I [Clostridia bacterium]|nr:signal peptidase I [Clostridia bacterium]
MTNTKKAKSIKTIIGIVTTAVLVAAIVFCVVIAVQVFGKGYASFGDNSMFRVITGSMEPAINENSLIVAKNIPIEDVKVGDIVTFRSRSAEMAGSIITHRVVRIDKGDSGKVFLFTKGDANSAEDVIPVDRENYIGTVTKIMQSDSFLPLMLSFFTSESGFVVCIVLPILVIAGIMMQKSIKNIKRDMTSLVSEIDKIKNDVNDNSAANEKSLLEAEKNGKSSISDDEYNVLCEKIKSELVAEIMEELKDIDKR